MKSVLISLCFFSAIPVLATSPSEQQKIMSSVGFTQKLDTQLPLSLPFKDENGKDVTLGTYFSSHKPVLLNLVYYECPMLCTEVLNGVVRTLKAMPLKIGKDFNVVTVSFNPKETPDLALKKKEAYLKHLGQRGADTGWTFLTGDAASIDMLTKTVGFSYAWDSGIQQFAHASGIMIVTPQGKLARYFFGVEYPVQDVRLSLVEAGNGKIGTLVDQLLLYCYHYDPETGRYGVVIMRTLRVACAATFALLALIIGFALWRERASRLREGNA